MEMMMMMMMMMEMMMLMFLPMAMIMARQCCRDFRRLPRDSAGKSLELVALPVVRVQAVAIVPARVLASPSCEERRRRRRK
eukprot:525396-Hanusia_phi.AAC.1